MRRTNNSNPLQLFHRVQSVRLALPKRLRALGELAQKLDHCFCQLQQFAEAPIQDGNSAPPVSGTPQSQADGSQAIVGPPGVSPTTVSPTTVSPTDAMQLLQAANQIVCAQLLPRLAKFHVRIARLDELTEAQIDWLYQYFRHSIYPLLTPLAVDSAHPFPLVVPGPLYFLVTLRTVGNLWRLRNGHLSFNGTEQSATNGYASDSYMDEREVYGLVNLAGPSSRLVHIPPGPTMQPTAPTVLLWREEIIRHFISTIFVEMEVTGVYQFRVLRAGTPILIDQQGHTQGADDSVPPRARQIPVVHIDVEQAMPSHLVQWLVNHLHASTDCVLQCTPPLAMADLGELADYLTTG